MRAPRAAANQRHGFVEVVSTFPWYFTVQRCSLSSPCQVLLADLSSCCTGVRICSTILVWALLFSSGLWVTGGTTENNILQDPFALLQSCVKILCYLYLICLLGVWFNAMAFWNPKGKGSHTCTWTEIENVIILWTPGSDWTFLCRGSSRPEGFLTSWVVPKSSQHVQNLDVWGCHSVPPEN